MSEQRTLKILQYNIRKEGDKILTPLIEDVRVKEYDILAIQEPWHNSFVRTSYNPYRSGFHLAFSEHAESRVCFYINTRINTNQWRVEFTSKDAATLTLRKSLGTTATAEGEEQEIKIHNIYNPPPGSYSSRQEGTLEHTRRMLDTSGPQILLGDFNLHHPLWTGPTRPTQHNAADTLIEITEQNGMELMLPQGTITWERGASRSTIDLVFACETLAPRLLHCKVRRELDQSSDHLPISTTFFWNVTNTESNLARNWEKADKGKIKERVESLLGAADPDRVKQRGIEEEAQRIEEILKEAMEELVPTYRITPYCSLWWNADCERVVKRARRLRRDGWEPGEGERYKKYLEAVESKKKVIKKAKRDFFRQKISELTDNPTATWKMTKWARARSMLPKEIPQLPELKGLDGPATTPEAKIEVLKEKFFPVPPNPDMSDTINFEYPPELASDLRISKEEIEKAMRRLKAHKAPGPNQVPNEMIKCCADILIPHLEHLFNACVEQGVHPGSYRKAKTVVIRKPGKTDYAEAGSYRPIALLDTVGKVLETIMATRLSDLAEANMLLPCAQMGGRRGRSTTTALELLTEQIHTIWKQGTRKVASLLCLDQEQAFSNVRAERLKHNLKSKGIPKNIVQWVESFITNRETTLTIPGFESGAFKISTGIPQGSPISPILFLFFNAELIEACSQPGRAVSACGFIDDVNILVYGDSTEGNCHRLNNIHTRCEEWARRHGATFAPKKYELIHFTRTPKRFNMAATVNLNTIRISPSASVRVLGVQLDSKLKWGPHIKKIEAKMSTQTLALTKLTKSTWGASFANARHIYSAIIRPAWTYGSSVWFHPEGTKEAKKKIVQKMAVIQNKCLRVIAGAYKATSIPVLEAETFVPPPDLYLKRLALLNERRIRNTEGERTIKDACSAIARRLRAKRGKQRKIIPTPGEEKKKWAQKVLREDSEHAHNERDTNVERTQNTQEARTKPKCKIKQYVAGVWEERWKKFQETSNRNDREEVWSACENLALNRIKGHASLTRAQSTMLTLLRTEKIGLAAFLNSQKVPGYELPRCECGWARQTAKHIVMFCTRYAAARRRLLADTKCTDYRELLKRLTYTAKITKWMIARGILQQFSWAKAKQDEDDENQESRHSEAGSEQGVDNGTEPAVLP